MNLKTSALLISIFLLVNIASAYTTPGVSNTVNSSSVTSTQIISSSSSGSSSGGGVVTNEPYENIACSNRIEHDWRFDSAVAYLFRNCDEYDAIVNPKDTDYDVMLKLEILKGRSINVASDPIGSVYKHFNLYSGSKRFDKATIKFRVDGTWAQNMGSVVLQRWTGKEWTLLETKQVLSASSIYWYFEAQTNAFSNFAVVGIPKTVEAPVVVSTITSTPVPTTVQPTETPKEESDEFPTTMLLLALSAMFLIGLIYWLYKNRNEQ